jgi:NADH dehydrogenase
VLRDQQNASVVLGEVVAIDLGARRLAVRTLDRKSEIPFDSLIVAAGATQSYFGHPEFAHDAPGMKTIDDALELRGRILGAFEMAEHEPDPEDRRRFLTFVVIGAGPTGVELAGQLAELSRHTLRRNFRRIDPGEARILLLDAAPSVLSAMPEELQRRALRDLRKIGVEFHPRTTVTHVDPRGMNTYAADGTLHRIEAATKIWAAGVQGSPLGRMLAEADGAALDRAGRVKVEDDCTLPGHPAVFVIGDLMCLRGLPGVSQVALQSGRHAADTIRRRLAGETASKPFHYRDLGSMATISRFRALAAIGRLRLTGFPAWVTWLFVHLSALTGFKHRLSVFFNWVVGLLGGGRAERVITLQQVFARQAMAAQAAAPPVARRA